jgi:hypothetical protein
MLTRMLQMSGDIIGMVQALVHPLKGEKLRA